MKTAVRGIVILSVFACLAAYGQGQPRPMQFVEVNSVRLAYEVVGQGEPVLLIHGGILADAYVRFFNEPALQNYQLVAYHRRAYGQSEAGEGAESNSLTNQVLDAAGLLEFLGIESAHVVGHSAGGEIATALAIDRPDLVHSLVLLEGSWVRVEDFGPENLSESSRLLVEDVNRQISQDQARGARDSREARELTAREFLNPYIARNLGEDWEAHTLPFVPDAWDQAIRWGRLRFFATDRATPETRSLSEFRSMTQPTTWIWSAEPNRNALRSYPFYAALLPDMEVQTVSGVGHGLQIIEPRPVAEAVSAFLEKYPMQDR